MLTSPNINEKKHQLIVGNDTHKPVLPCDDCVDVFVALSAIKTSD